MNLRAYWTPILLPFLATFSAAAEGFLRVPPTEPNQAAKMFEVLQGFRMELIAAEPLVASPVDVAYDEDGRAYVVEMRDYPYPEEKNAEPKEFPGTVRLLEDTDGDGRFDKATVFADQLAWPTSACCWKGGVFVAAAPDIWYFKDTSGDGRADIRRKVFTGFGRYNVQAIMNNLRWGLDSKIYGAAAGNGGSIRHAERPDEPPISLARRDFRFDPVTEKLEAISGGERFGNTFDDWGNRFVCNIRNPVQHVVLEQRYLARNPHFVAPSVIHDCAESGDQLRVFRLSPPEPWRIFRAQRWALEGQAMPRSELIGAGYWTSSSGVTVYRGGAYPAEFRGNVFIGEVAGNLVHRQLLTRDGVTFKSRRADENTEFIRSRDNWFRPVNFVNAPDGTLHVVDMYRETIEHPWSIPDDIKAQLDLTSGKERGRIYRLSPPKFTASQPPRLLAATTAELVAHLESPHSWYRETAQRLLVERQDKDGAVPLLAKCILDREKSATSRLHAIYALSSMEMHRFEMVVNAISHDPAPELVTHAVLLAERECARGHDLAPLIVRCAGSEDMAVRFQAALSLGDAKADRAYAGLSKLMARDAADLWMQTALLSSAAKVADRLALDLIRLDQSQINRRDQVTLARRLTALAAAAQDERALARLLHAAAWNDAGLPLELRLAILSGASEGLATRKERLGDFARRVGEETAAQVNKVLSESAGIAMSGGSPAERISALTLMAFSPWEVAREPLLASLQSKQPPEIQQMALRVLGKFDESDVASELVQRWRQLTPPLRDEAASVLLSRPLWHQPMIAALEKGDILVSQLSIPQRSRLAAVKDAALAERAKKILERFAVGPRKEVLDKYLTVTSLKADAARGAVIYRRECANCHKLGGEGHEVGPNLATIVHRSPPEILIHVLDPNREVSPQFLDYTVRLTDGRVLTGMISTETDAGLTLRRAENREDTILRSEIDDITSSGKSLMPEGLEQKISLEEMADLIAHLKSLK